MNGHPQVCVLRIKSTGIELTQSEILEVRQRFLSNAPSDWRLARRNEPATLIVDLVVKSRDEKQKFHRRGLIWSDYAYTDNGEGGDYAWDDEASTYIVPVSYFGYPFGGCEFSFSDFYYNPGVEYYPRKPCPPPLKCPPGHRLPGAVHTVKSYALPAAPKWYHLAPASRPVEIARADVRPGFFQRFISQGSTGQARSWAPSAGGLHSSGGSQSSGGGWSHGSGSSYSSQSSSPGGSSHSAPSSPSSSSNQSK
jgi:hypothetical protein